MQQRRQQQETMSHLAHIVSPRLASAGVRVRAQRSCSPPFGLAICRTAEPMARAANCRCQLSKWIFEANGIHHVLNGIHMPGTWWMPLLDGPAAVRRWRGTTNRHMRTLLRGRSVSTLCVPLTNGTTIATSCGGIWRLGFVASNDAVGRLTRRRSRSHRHRRCCRLLSAASVAT